MRQQRQPRQVFLMVAKGCSCIEKWLVMISAFILFCMMMLTSVDVCMRYLFNRPIAGVYELMEFLLVGASVLVVRLDKNYVTGKIKGQRDERFGLFDGTALTVVLFPGNCWISNDFDKSAAALKTCLTCRLEC